MTLASILETILFVHGSPVSLEKLSALAGVSGDAAAAALAELAQSYEDGGLVLIEKDGMYQLGTRPEYAKYIEALAHDEFSEDLSRSTLETIAIIAYKGPLSRVEIEHIRGVNASYALRNLLLRGLIERDEHRAPDARGYRYRVSMDFLKHLGLATMDDLPGYQEFKNQAVAVPAYE